MAKLKLTYPKIKDNFGGWLMTQPTETRAFLAWYLEYYYHLDETEIQDAICDRSHDKGFDAVYVNEATERIYVFQNEMSRSPTSAIIGDTEIKEFHGSLAQLQSSNSVRMLETSVQINDDLKKLLKREKIADKIEKKFEVFGIFLTNRTRNADAKDYLKHCLNITLIDAPELEKNYVPLDEVISIREPISFDITSVPAMDYPIDDNVRMVIAPISAQELIKMEGIFSGELFAPNVRYWLGKGTPVNKGIEKSIKDKKKKNEHKYFPTFHNGLVVRCNIEKFTKNKITIKDYSVVNGCQSLRGLFDNQTELTPELRILTKFIQVIDNPQLIKEITYRTNNQNAIKSRDLQSNSTIQRRLRDQIKVEYKGEFLYRRSRGEQPRFNKEKVIENTLAGQLLLSFDIKKPEGSHLIDGRIFVDWHGDVFGRQEVNADRIVALYELFKTSFEQLGKLADKGFASYTLTRFVMVYLIREVLELDALGKKFIENPSPFVKTEIDRERFKFCIGTIASVLARGLDSYFRERNKRTDFFDYKSELKNAETVNDIKELVVMNRYQVILDDESTKPFSALWEISKEKYEKRN